ALPAAEAVGPLLRTVRPQPVLLLVEPAEYGQLAQPLPAALQAVLLLVQAAALDQLVNPAGAPPPRLGVPILRLRRQPVALRLGGNIDDRGYDGRAVRFPVGNMIRPHLVRREQGLLLVIIHAYDLSSLLMWIWGLWKVIPSKTPLLF